MSIRVIKMNVIDEVVEIVTGHNSGWQDAQYAASAGIEHHTWEKKCFCLVDEHSTCHERLERNLINTNHCGHQSLSGLPASYVATLGAGSTIIGKRLNALCPLDAPREFKCLQSRSTTISTRDYIIPSI